MAKKKVYLSTKSGRAWKASRMPPSDRRQAVEISTERGFAWAAARFDIGWVTPGAILDLDFENGRFFFDGELFSTFSEYLAAVDGSFSRSSAKFALDRAGDLVSFDIDSPAITDMGLLLEPAAANFAPYSSVLQTGWAFTNGGTGTLGATPAAATLSSAAPSPDGLNADPGEGITCTGLCWDAARSRFLVGNDGRNKDGNPDGTENTGNGIWTTSIVAVDASLSKTGEWALTWPGDSQNNRGVQGITIDTASDLVAACVPSLAIIAFFNPATLAFVSQIDLIGITQPNGLTYDSLRDGFWITNNADQNIYLVDRAGAIVRTYVPTPAEKVGLDHLCYRAATDDVLFTYGDNNTSGTVKALDCDLLRTTVAMTCVEAKAIEGIAVHGSDVLICSDGYFHSVPPGNVASPYNVNVILTYPASALASFAFQRVWANYSDYRRLGKIADRVIFNKGAGATANDFNLLGVVGLASGASEAKKFSIEAMSADGGTYTIALRADTAIQNIVVGPTLQEYEVSGTLASAPTLQIGLRKGGAPYNTSDFADVIICGLQLERGNKRTSWINNTGNSAGSRAADSGILADLAQARDLIAKFDDGSTQVLAGISGEYAVPTNLNRPYLARLTG